MSKSFFSVVFQFVEPILSYTEIEGTHSVGLVCETIGVKPDELQNLDVYGLAGHGLSIKKPVFIHKINYTEALEVPYLYSRTSIEVECKNVPLSFEDSFIFFRKDIDGDIALDSERVAKHLYEVWKSYGFPDTLESFVRKKPVPNYEYMISRNMICNRDNIWVRCVDAVIYNQEGHTDLSGVRYTWFLPYSEEPLFVSNGELLLVESRGKAMLVVAVSIDYFKSVEEVDRTGIPDRKVIRSLGYIQNQLDYPNEL